ncbi:MAG: hypothetical protein ABIN20_00300 [candidate division WOR-3 bacterium]
MNLFVFFLLSQTISTLVGGDYIKSFPSGKYIYEVSQRGVAIINVENPQDPFTEYEIPTQGISMDLAISGNNLYILDSQEGIIVYSLKERVKKNTFKVKNANSIISIPPYLYVGTSDGFIEIYEVNGFNLKGKGKIKLNGPLNSIQIAPQGLVALISDSILSHIKFLKEGNITVGEEYVSPSKLTKFLVLDTLILFGKKEGGFYLGKFSKPFIEIVKEIIPTYVITGLQIYGSQVFVGTEDGRLYLLSYPDLNIISTAQLVGQINDFVAIGNILMASVGRAGISVLRLPELEEIKTLGGFGSLVSANIMTREVLYLLDPLLGIRFISFFSPHDPQKEEETELFGTFVKILKFKDLIIAAIREGGIWILNADRINEIRGFLPIEGFVNDCINIENKIFVATEKGIIGLEYKDGKLSETFSIKTDTKTLKLIQIGKKFASLQENGLFIYDYDGKIIEHKMDISPYLYTLRGREVFVCDMTGKLYKFEETLQNMSFLFSIKVPVTDFVVGKNEIYVADATNKIRVYSIPAKNLKFSFDLPEPVYYLKMKYPYLFIYGVSDRIFIYNVGKDVPEFVNSIRTKKSIRSLDFSESGIYVGEERFIETYRFYRFEAPTEISYYLTYGELYRAVPLKEDNVLYIAGGSSGLIGIDLTNIYSPELFFHHIPSEGVTYDILISQRFLICANLEGGIEVFELLSNKKPKFFTKIKGDVLSIDVVNNTFLVAGDRTGIIKVYDMRGGVFSQISEFSELKFPVLDLESFGNYVYASFGDEGIGIIDMSVPHFPRLKKIINPGFPVFRLKILDDRVFAICGAYGVIEYKLKEDGDLIYLNHIDTPGNAQDVNKMEDYYLISDTYGLEIYRRR